MTPVPSVYQLPIFTKLNPTYQYQPGGSLPPDAPTYVVRQTDTELYTGLLAGDYCYVLNARQMGKSSLRVRTMAKLQAEGIACAEIELSGIGSQQITASQWYGGIIQELVSGFNLQINRRNWLKEHDDLSPIQCLNKFIETVLLTQIQEQIIIFIDEIDNVLGLKFSTDEFFALIRHCYENRAIKPVCERLCKKAHKVFAEIS
ncbi:AAA-like domain-containing protein [Sphaerospermopsis aphanizomenoides]|uniref:AAA-like domain-containing protein n=1 Tax=Sphaerospermopsis aphanizomenoides TaxID=459663 RepID=UPI0022787C5D